MKNFFQRRPDTQPNAPAKDAYKVWLPPPDAPRASTPTGPTTWVSASGQSGARSGGETHRSSSRAPRADAYSVPTSSTYKYATLPNNAGFYSNPAPTLPSQPFPPQYYPSSLPRPPPGYIPSYPYPNPQQPQSFAAAPAPSQPVASKGREDRTRYASDGRGANTVPAMGRPSSSRQHSEKDDGSRAPRQPSSSKREEVEMKKPKHRTREPSEPRKRRDSQAGDSYAEKYRDKSSRKESRRDGKFRPDLRVEEGDSSDSSIRRPPSSAGHRSRRMEEGKPSMMNKPKPEPIPLTAGSRAGLPMQPTAASSSSGKQTPQLPRMPVYLPANHGKSQRPDEGQPGLSESDTDHGMFTRGRNFLRGAESSNMKQQSKPTTVPPELPALNKKVKESKGLWPFSRSKSSQKLPPNISAIPPSTAKIPAKKIRAESTPSRFPQLPVDNVLAGRPEYRRHASDNAIGDQTYRAPASQPRARPVAPDVQPSSSRDMFFTTPSESLSRPITTASQQAALHSLRSRSSANEVPVGPNPGPQAIEHPPTTIVPSSTYRQSPLIPPGAPYGQVSGATLASDPIRRPETPLRRDGRDKSNLPPIYASASGTRTADYPRVPDRSTTPKVSQLVAGFEARASDIQTHNLPTAARREVAEKTLLPQMHAPSQQSSQGTGDAPTSTQRLSSTANPYVVASQPPFGPQLHAASDVPTRPLVESSNTYARPTTNQPDVLKTQLRDLLSDRPFVSQTDEKVQARGTNLPPESRLHQTAGPLLYSNSKPSDWNPSSQLYAFAQPPIQVYTAGTSSMPLKSGSKSEKPVEISANPAPSASSRKPDVSQSDPADRTSRVGTSRPGDDRDVDRAHGRPSRSKKDPIAVMKTPSKDSSRHTSSPSPVLLPHSTNQSRSNDKSTQLQSAVSQPPSTSSRSQPHTVYPEAQITGRHDAPYIAPDVPLSSSLAPGDRSSQRDHRTTSTQAPGKPNPHTTPVSHVPPPPGHSERSRPAPSASALPFPSSQSLPAPSNSLPVRPSSRSAVPASGPAPITEAPPVLAQSTTRPSATPGSSSNSRTVARVPSEESILKTPSSLAHSVLQPSISHTSIPASVSSEARKKGIFGMFRSKAAQQLQTPAFEVRPVHSTKTPDRGPQSSSESVAHPVTASDRQTRSKHKIPPPITVPNPALPISDRKSPNSRVFTPFRYLTSKRNRRISTASMDAVDGTAPNTVMGSPTASMQSSQMPPQSPPQRDPRVATQDWRNQEESEVKARGKPRRMRPGVVFDVAEDPLEETKRSRPTRVKKAQPSSAEAPTDSSDG